LAEPGEPPRAPVTGTDRADIHCPRPACLYDVAKQAANEIERAAGNRK
jgi:hypothetical protein